MTTDNLFAAGVIGLVVAGGAYLGWSLAAVLAAASVAAIILAIVMEVSTR